MAQLSCSRRPEHANSLPAKRRFHGRKPGTIKFVTCGRGFRAVQARCGVNGKHCGDLTSGGGRREEGGGRRAECGCSFGPGVARITICSCMRIGPEGDSVQFIVLMERISFPCMKLKPFRQKANRTLTKRRAYKLCKEDQGKEWREYSLKASLAGRTSGGAGGICRTLPLAGWPSARVAYSGTISFIFSRMAAVAIADIAARSSRSCRRRSIQR